MGWDKCKITPKGKKKLEKRNVMWNFLVRRCTGSCESHQTVKNIERKKQKSRFASTTLHAELGGPDATYVLICLIYIFATNPLLVFIIYGDWRSHQIHLTTFSFSLIAELIKWTFFQWKCLSNEAKIK